MYPVLTLFSYHFLIPMNIEVFLGRIFLFHVFIVCSTIPVESLLPRPEANPIMDIILTIILLITATFKREVFYLCMSNFSISTFFSIFTPTRIIFANRNVFSTTTHNTATPLFLNSYINIITKIFKKINKGYSFFYFYYSFYLCFSFSG